MIVCKLLFIFLLTSYILLMNSAIKVEELIGGNLAYQPNYRYQVAVFGKYNKTQARNLLCSGAIISDFFILSSAQCFLGSKDQLKRLRFYIIVGLVSLTADDNFTREILRIYTYGQRTIEVKNEIAVLELIEGLNMRNIAYLRGLKLPAKNESFEGRQGHVSGYGSTSINRLTNVEIRFRNRITDTSRQNLTYAYVDIAQRQDCLYWYFYIDPAKEMCGVIKPNYSHRLRGLCTYDEGAPLVIENTIVGIANKNRRDCNDTVYGSIYTKVPYFVDFITAVMSGNHLPGTMVFLNRPYI